MSGLATLSGLGRASEAMYVSSLPFPTPELDANEGGKECERRRRRIAAGPGSSYWRLALLAKCVPWPRRRPKAMMGTWVQVQYKDPSALAVSPPLASLVYGT